MNESPVASDSPISDLSDMTKHQSLLSYLAHNFGFSFFCDNLSYLTFYQKYNALDQFCIGMTSMVHTSHDCIGPNH